MQIRIYLNFGLKSDFFVLIHTNYAAAYTAYYKYYGAYNHGQALYICIDHNADRNI